MGSFPCPFNKPLLAMEPEVFSSGYLVFRKQKKLQFLLMKHANRWDLPKGHLDPGESKHQAAIRELSEETGIDCSDLETIPEFEFQQQYWVTYQKDGGGKKWKELTIYLGLLTKDVNIQATEHLGFEWRDWSPPHQIQTETIDPLLQCVESFFDRNSGFWNA